MVSTRRNRSDQTSPVPATTILDLNEHCLLEIFRFLSPLDMCSVRDICKRLREVANTHMKTFYRSNELVLSDQHKTGYKMMYKFGMAVTRMRIELLKSPIQRSKVVASWFRECKPKLLSLTLVHTDFNVGLSLCPLLENVRQFRIEYVANKKTYCSDIQGEENIKQMLKSCKNVEEFSLKKLDTQARMCQGIFLQQKFKQIRSLEVYELRGFDINNLKLFLKFNRNVQSVSLKHCIPLSQLGEFNWPHYAPNVETLSLEFGEDDFSRSSKTVFNVHLTNMLSQLKKLKCLTLDACGMNVTDFIATMAKRNLLTHLSIINLMPKVKEGLDKVLSFMTNLKVLRLELIHTSYYMITAVALGNDED